jgi:hypothetical protein
MDSPEAGTRGRHLAPLAVAVSPDGEVTDEQVVVVFIDREEK